MSHTVLITGGAGYIGSNCALTLLERGYKVIILDNLSRGHVEIVQKLPQATFVHGNIDDAEALTGIVRHHQPAAVMHFAAYAYVGESVTEPARYYQNNVLATLQMLEILRAEGLKKIIFSSTCATYGTPEKLPITETTPQAPVNPYGESKLMVEKILRDLGAAYGLESVIFRYFNAAGAHPSALIGECHDPETHLIPLALDATLNRPPLKVFGGDYPTPDGSCIRDYIHISDIAAAHILGLEYLLSGGRSEVFNIGTGTGNSVFEVIKTVEQVTGRAVQYSVAPRRAGDPAVLVAEATKLKRELGWSPQYPTLTEIIETAWRWHQRWRNVN